MIKTRKEILLITKCRISGEVVRNTKYSCQEKDINDHAHFGDNIWHKIVLQASKYLAI